MKRIDHDFKTACPFKPGTLISLKGTGTQRIYSVLGYKYICNPEEVEFCKCKSKGIRIGVQCCHHSSIDTEYCCIFANASNYTHRLGTLLWDEYKEDHNGLES